MSLNIKKNNLKNSVDIEIMILGDIDIDTSLKFKEDINRLVDDSKGDVFINLKDVTYIDSTGLGILLAIMKKIKINSRNMILVNPQKNVMKLLEITGLSKILKIQ